VAMGYTAKAQQVTSGLAGIVATPPRLTLQGILDRYVGASGKNEFDGDADETCHELEAQVSAACASAGPSRPLLMSMSDAKSMPPPPGRTRMKRTRSAADLEGFVDTPTRARSASPWSPVGSDSVAIDADGSPAQRHLDGASECGASDTGSVMADSEFDDAGLAGCLMDASDMGHARNL
jgi:hypothetical protein